MPVFKYSHFGIACTLNQLEGFVEILCNPGRHMGVGIDANGYILLPEDTEVFAVGVEITDRPVPSVCIDLKSNIMLFEATGQFPVKVLRVGRWPESVNCNQVAMCNYVEQSGSGSCRNVVEIVLIEPVYILPLVEFPSKVNGFISQVMDRSDCIIELQALQERVNIVFLPREIVNFKAFSDLYAACIPGKV